MSILLDAVRQERKTLEYRFRFDAVLKTTQALFTEDKKVTLQNIANELGVGCSTIRNWEQESILIQNVISTYKKLQSSKYNNH